MEEIGLVLVENIILYYCGYNMDAYKMVHGIVVCGTIK